MCVANRIVDRKQHTITWHVDDDNFSQENTKVNDEFWIGLSTSMQMSTLEK